MLCIWCQLNTTNTSGAFEIGVLKEIKVAHREATFLLVVSLVPLIDSQHIERNLNLSYYK